MGYLICELTSPFSGEGFYSHCFQALQVVEGHKLNLPLEEELPLRYSRIEQDVQEGMRGSFIKEDIFYKKSFC